MFSSVARSATPIDSNTLQMRRSSNASRPETIGADDPDLGETAGARITRKRAASRPIFERDSARDAIVLVMPEDGKTRFGRQAAGQSRALIADRMAVTLFVGGDAGVSGDVAMGSGKTTSRARELKRDV